MSSSSSAGTPTPESLLPPPGTNWLAAIDPAIKFLMIGATMGAVLVTMLLALFFFSTRSLRRKPIFILNVVAIFLGLASAIIVIYDNIRGLKYPGAAFDSPTLLTKAILSGIAPIFVDSILLFRIYAVFPPRQTKLWIFISVMAFPVLFKIGRLINMSIYLKNYAQDLHSFSTNNNAGKFLLTSPSPSVKIEWFFQVFDDLLSSGLFLFPIYRTSNLRDRTRTISQSIRDLFWISTSNFVFPVILAIAQLIIYFGKPNDFFLVLYVEEVNYHFTIIGVVFATLWVAETHWAGENKGDTSVIHSTLHFPVRRVGRAENSLSLASDGSMLDASSDSSNTNPLARESKSIQIHGEGSEQKLEV